MSQMSKKRFIDWPDFAFIANRVPHAASTKIAEK